MNEKNKFREDNFKVIEIVKNKDKESYLDFLELDIEEKRSFRFEYLNEIEYSKFLNYVKNKKKKLMRI